MKKIIYSMLALVALTSMFISCGSDDPAPKSQTPAEFAVGTYKGTFKVTIDDTETKEYIGNTVTLAAGKTGNDVKVNVTCGEAAGTGETVASITWANDDVKFINQETAGTLNTKIDGMVTSAGVMTLYFTKIHKVGRTSHVYKFAFTGTKN